jgi:hypothetical protein
MAEVLRSFDELIRDESGIYHARVVGRAAPDGMWDGWLEFVPLGRHREKTLVSPLESRQPERSHLAYWASGLTVVYAEGALQRARHPLVVHQPIVETPDSDAPAPRYTTQPTHVAVPDAILDPFEVGSHNLDILAQELRALNRPRLLNIITAYDLNRGEVDLPALTDGELIGLIVGAVENAITNSRARA